MNYLEEYSMFISRTGEILVSISAQPGTFMKSFLIDMNLGGGFISQ